MPDTHSTTLVYNNYNSDVVLKDANSAGKVFNSNESVKELQQTVVGAVEADLRILAQERHQQQAANAAN